MKASLNSVRAHLAKVHSVLAEDAYLLFVSHPGPCTQCFGPVKFLSFQSGYERLCGKCSKKNSQLRGAETRKRNNTPAWNKGLTEQTSESVRIAATKCRDFIKKNGHWRSGQTKENSASVAQAAVQISKTLTEKWKKEKHWTQHGQTSETDDRIKRRSENLSESVKSSHWVHKACADRVKQQIIQTRKRLIELGVNSPFRITHEMIAERLESVKDKWNVDSYEVAGFQSLIVVSCKECGETCQVKLSSLCKGKLCSTCNPRVISRWQSEIYEYVLTLDPGATLNDRKRIAPLELDILSSDQRFAIECNGLYWHSDAVISDSEYHQKKSDLASTTNTSLLHVFEDEWQDLTKREIIKSMIRVKLQKAKKIFARRLRVRAVHPASVAEFLVENHIDGNVPASKGFILETENGETVATLTVRKPHQIKKWSDKTLEIARVAFLKNTVVVGGMSKLISAAATWAKENSFDRIMTYRDTRLGGSGNGYLSSGFVVSHETKPRFWWTDCHHRLDRFLVRSIPNIASQESLAFEHKLFKIYGCKNVVYVRKL